VLTLRVTDILQASDLNTDKANTYAYLHITDRWPAEWDRRSFEGLTPKTWDRLHAGDISSTVALRGVPILEPSDFRVLKGYLICSDEQTNEVELGGASPGRRVEQVIEVLSATHRQVYRDEALFEESINPLGVVPVVHIQDTSQPFAYEGVSEVEPLIATQDELNTRLSDRAHRVTLQSFKMYLAKGIDGFADTPVGPGQVWSTENENAEVEAFGGDMNAPSEESHITELREAMDKISSVSPVVIGVIRERLGQLSSENALRVTLTGILAKTERKRVVYGRGIAQMCGLILRALDSSGVYRTGESERGVQIKWQRSEERRVGKECRSRWSPYH